MDQEAVDHEREFGAVPVIGDVVRIRVAQRVDFDLLADPVIATAHPPRIGVGELFEMTGPQAVDIAHRLLRAAASMEDRGDAQARRPRLVAEA
ncbi:hypothetical protein GCM10022223_41430 [Kineosporia mesophila]|uniref:Uncharacterized protein n=1 Tax=Kineosporia mesophila TaxID=566012 RepID=A0ABP6ZYJ5_9ACTN|nr:hypothetical protein [Kineosporia mesophila]MCD5348758.1 hypothetical protein [Kineosporia mesophila]